MTLPIPNFELYGEAEASPIPDILHCESIAERSRVHDGLIKAHRHDGLTQVLYARSGSIRAHLEDAQFDLGGRFLILVPSLSVHGFEISADTEGWVLTLPDAGLKEILRPAPQIGGALNRPQVFIDGNAPLPFDRIDVLFCHIAEEFAGTDPARRFVLRSAIGHLLALIARAAGAPGGRGIDIHARGTGKLGQFRDRIEERFRHHDSIRDYARHIAVTPAQLNRICRAITGKSALRIVHERIMIEAKRDLCYSTMTIGEIAQVLGFGDPAYFTRFFARNAGASPARYRRHVHVELSTKHKEKAS